MLFAKSGTHGTAVEGFEVLPTLCSVILALADDTIFQSTQNMVNEKLKFRRCQRSDIPYGERSIKGQAGYLK